MWKTLIAALLKQLIEAFLKNLGTTLGIPAGAAPLYDPTSVNKAIEMTADDLSK